MFDATSISVSSWNVVLAKTITVLENLELLVQVYSWYKQNAMILSKKRQGTLTCNGD